MGGRDHWTNIYLLLEQPDLMGPSCCCCQVLWVRWGLESRWTPPQQHVLMSTTCPLSLFKQQASRSVKWNKKSLQSEEKQEVRSVYLQHAGNQPPEAEYSNPIKSDPIQIRFLTSALNKKTQLRFSNPIFSKKIFFILLAAGETLLCFFFCNPWKHFYTDLMDPSPLFSLFSIFMRKCFIV